MPYLTSIGGAIFLSRYIPAEFWLYGTVGEYALGFVPMWFINWELAPQNKRKVATWSVIIAIVLHVAFWWCVIPEMGHTY